MTYTIKAIPTTYAGVNFRSRLEARWAAFFDLCGWEWDYEPFDLDGWAPDFLLKGKVKALVEVKPIDFRGDERQMKSLAMAKAKKAFMTASRIAGKRRHVDDMTEEEAAEYAKGFAVTPEYEILVIGNGPARTGIWPKWSLGVMALEKWCFGSDVADLFLGHEAVFDYAARFGNFAYRIGGQSDGDHHLKDITNDLPEALWREAGNTVQWKPERIAA